MENNTLNENASGDCDEKDAKTASFLKELRPKVPHPVALLP